MNKRDKEAKTQVPRAGLAARQAAFFALSDVFVRRQMLPSIDKGTGLTAADAARAQRLAIGVLRQVSALDTTLAKHTQKTPAMPVRVLLRLGAFELLSEQAAAHGVVDSYVELAKARAATRRAAGLINAVLRKVAETAADWTEPAPQRLPAWLRKLLVKAHGAEGVAAMEAAHAAGAAIDLTLREGTPPPPDAVELPTGSYRLPAGVQVSALPGYDTGGFWVQDAAAALPARLLSGFAGQDVLDLCAAPGGKTMQLAAQGARVTALDISEKRLARVRENLDRVGCDAELVCADALKWDGGSYDAILLDAPCSATGTIRRHPELPSIRGPQEVERLTKLQMRLIDRALGWLKPGGQLLYCTCSLLPNEGENQVKAALGRHPELSVLPHDPVAYGGEPGWQSAEGGWRLRPDFWPEIGGMDGFYICALQWR